MRISMERRIRKKKRMDGEGLTDLAPGFDAELKREMLCVIGWLRKYLADFSKFMILQTNTPFFYRQICLMIIMILSLAKEDIANEEFFTERKRLQYFVEASGNDKIDGPFELLSFTDLGDSAPNIVILLRIFLTRAISVASCERSFSKLKLIKNYLRSAMSQTRLADLAVLI